MKTPKPARLVSRRWLLFIVLTGMLILTCSSMVVASAETASLPLYASQLQQGAITVCTYDTEGDPMPLPVGICGDRVSPGSCSVFAITSPGDSCVSIPIEEPGVYYITATPPGPDWTQVWPEFGYYEIYAEPFGYYHVDFVFFNHVTVSGTKYEDLDADGARDPGEIPLENVTIYVDINENEQFDPWESHSTTGPDGQYNFTFTYPWPTTVKIREVVPPGWVCTYPSPCVHEVSVISGVNLPDTDFGNARYGTVSGYKWQDYNRNGLWDDLVPRIPEPALSNWPITLFDLGSNEITSLTTGADGSYVFREVVPGVDNLVCEGSLPGWTQTYPVTASLCDAGLGPFGYRFELMSGANVDNKNFGNRREQGCTYTQGYWKNHTPASAQPNISWYDLVGNDVAGNPASGPTVEFYDSRQSWLDVLNTPPRGNAYYILAHQFIAAVLNVMNGSDPTLIGAALTDAAHLLDSYDQLGNPPIPSIPRDSADRALAVALADLLDRYNRGYIGPGSCTE